MADSTATCATAALYRVAMPTMPSATSPTNRMWDITLTIRITRMQSAQLATTHIATTPTAIRYRGQADPSSGRASISPRASAQQTDIPASPTAPTTTVY